MRGDRRATLSAMPSCRLRCCGYKVQASRGDGQQPAALALPCSPVHLHPFFAAALQGPFWRLEVLRHQTELGRSRLGESTPPGAVIMSQLDCLDVRSNRASE